MTPTKSDGRAIYLNYHSATSVGAIEMIERLIKAYEGKPIGQFFRELYIDIRSHEFTNQVQHGRRVEGREKEGLKEPVTGTRPEDECNKG